MLRDLINRPSGPREVNQDTVVVPDMTDAFVRYVQSIQRIGFEPQFSKIYTLATMDGKEVIKMIETMNASIIKERIKMNKGNEPR